MGFLYLEAINDSGHSVSKTISKIHVAVEMVGFCTWRLGLVAWFLDYLDMERKEAIWMGAQMNVNVLNSRKTKPQALKDLTVVETKPQALKDLFKD